MEGSKSMGETNFNNVNETSTHEQSLSGRNSTLLKRPRPSSEDSAPLRETLKAFGQRATALDKEISDSTAFDCPSVASQKKMWALILELRPYVCASLSSSQLELPVEMKKLCQINPYRISKYVQLALRIYISVARIAAVVPGVLLHCALTLLSLLPVMGTPAQRGAADERMLFRGIHQTLIGLCCQYPMLFRQLLHALLQEDTMGAFIFSLRRRPSNGRCIIVIREPPVVHGVSTNTESLFESNIIAENKYESVCVACGFCDIMTELFNSNVSFQPTLNECSILLRLACSLLAVDLKESSVSRLGGGGNQLKNEFSNRYQHEENKGSVLALLQASAGSVLSIMTSNGLLIKAIHGHILLYTLVQHLREMSQAGSENHNITWELDLLRWLVDKREERDTGVVSLTTKTVKEKQLLELVKPSGLPRKWLQSFFRRINILKDMLFALIWCATRENSMRSYEMADLLLQLLQEAMLSDVDMSRLMEQVFYGAAEDMINALFGVRPTPSLLWFADISPRVGVLHRLLRLFPPDVVSPFIERHLSLCSEKRPEEVHLLAAVNASVVVSYGASTRATLLEDAWRRLVTVGSVVAVDAVVILLRASEMLEVEQMAMKSLKLLNTSHVTLRCQDSSLHISLLYAALVESLPINSVNASFVICDAIKTQSEETEMNLWRITGVLRGFRKRVAQRCLHIMNSFSCTVASTWIKEARTSNEEASTLFTALKEICNLMKSLTLIFPSLFTEKGVSVDALVLFWKQMVTLLVETLSIAEWLRINCYTFSSVGTTHSSEVIVLDDNELEDEERSLNNGVVLVPSNKVHQGHRVECEEEEEGQADDCNTHLRSAAKAETLLRDISASLEAMGKVARHLLFAGSLSTGGDTLSNTLLAFICLCVALSSVRCTAMEEVVFSRGLSHMNRIIRRGYAALALRMLLARWEDAGVVGVFLEKIEQFREEGEETHLLFYLEALEVSFTGECQHLIVQKAINDDDTCCACVVSLPLVVSSWPDQKQGHVTHCNNLLDLCITIWEHNSMTMSTKFVALGAARAIMLNLSLSVVDLFWRDTDMIYTSFFKAMCDAEGNNLREIILASLEDLLCYSLRTEDDTEKLERVFALLGEKPTFEFIFPRLMACILFEYAQASVSVKQERVEKLLALQSRPLEDLPEMMLHSRQPLIMSLIYLEAGRELREATLGQRGNANNVEEANKDTGFLSSNFDLAMEVSLSLMECVPSVDMILQALSSPEARTTKGKALAKDVFYVLDAVAKLVGISNASFKKAHHVPVCIARRCLSCLTLLIRYLGTYATSLAPKLPAILEHCSSRPQLVRPVCVVWHDLLSNCTKEYLKEHSPAIVVDLLSIGQLAEGSGVDGDVLSLLEAAMRVVYESTLHEAFWESYFKVMGKTNELIRRLKADCIESPSCMISGDVKEGPVQKKSNAAFVITGFLSVMHSSSTKCKEVFVRALFQYLSTTDNAGRMEMTHAAVETPQLIPTLLKCAYELHEDYVEYVLACVGIIGAVSHPNATLLASEKKMVPRGVSTLLSIENNHTTPLRELHFLPEDVLDWRSLAHKLLSIYCPRAFANTADPTMHDRAAYAVQELLRVCTNEERRTVDRLPLQSQNVLHVDELQQYIWWSHLEPTCRQMLEGYTTTRYENRVKKRTEPRSPIYTANMPFHEWLDAWFCDLIERCEGVFKNLMYALRNMAKGDHVLITFLLPHIILHLLREGENHHRNAIFVEVTILLEAALPGASRQKEQMSSLYSQGILREVDTSVVVSVGVEEHLQQVFRILEDIEHLRLGLLRAIHHASAQRKGLVNLNEMREVVEICEKFLLRVEWTTKVEAAVAIGSNMRALRCIESQRYLPSLEEVVKKNVPLQRIFAALGDRDSSRSLHRRQEHQPKEAAFSYENNGEWSLALQACGVVLQQYPDSINHQFTALRCMQQLGQLHLMSRHCQALLMQSARVPSDTTRGENLSWEAKVAALQNYANEAAWRLGEWKNIKCRQDLPVGLALPMAAFTNLVEGKGTLNEVFLACKLQRRKIAPLIRAGFRESYAQVYPHVVVLHALTDIEAAAESMRPSLLEREGKTPSFHVGLTSDSQRLQEFGSLLQQRARLIETTQETQELLISLHRSIFRAFRMKEEVTKTWMQYAKMLRDEGFLEAALSAAEQVRLGDGFVDPLYYTTVAKLLHEMNRSDQAIEFAENAANDLHIPLITRANLRVLVTRWRQETSYQTSQEVLAGYKSALSMNDSEKAHHFLALFYDALYRSLQGSSQVASTPLSPPSSEKTDEEIVTHVESYVLEAIHHFGMALRLGNKTLTVSLPRMLTLWLNCSTSLNTLTTKSGSVSALASSALTKMNNIMERLLLQNSTKLSVTQLITALPQLLSRIGHDNAQLVKIITKTVVDLMLEFPQQCLWQVFPIIFSKHQVRSEAANKDIIQEFLKRAPSQKKLKENMFNLFRSLIELCNCPAASLTDSRTSIEPSLAGQSFMQQIQRVLTTVKIILPTMANLSPNVMQVANSASLFSTCTAFQRLEDRVVIMSSLQKPKRITVINDEGERVPFLCKARDEPRKDMRMMEIASLMNSFFLTDPETRRKRFALRRYAVTALSDDCAIIEWVNNLSPFRKVVEDCYAMDGTGVRISQVKAWKSMVDNGSLSKMDMLRNYILPKAPPVLHGWFHRQFLNHQEWLNARNSYTQATALWSIAGHVVGLGDRHGENLMLDLSCGELMHVDFACLFDKGEMLEVPERVRFRLTQNVVDGMGVLGVDGPFRASCQAALRCQMKNKVAVMSVVETLLHEPLAEWTRHSSYRQKNFDPKHLIGRVSRRLDGFLDLYSSNRERDTFALSCEGQVSRLISHSSALENLADMYVWWMPWL